MSLMIQVQAPQPHPGGHYLSLPHIFLGGSIEMGKAEKWQDRVVADLAKQDVVIMNPRRDDWDSSWTQEIDNPQFFQQVSWELENLEQANIRIFYFDPNTQSPITLMELGLFGPRCLADEMAGDTTIVCCPKEYFRRGNVEIVCQRYDIKMVETYNDLIKAVKKALKNIKKIEQSWK